MDFSKSVRGSSQQERNSSRNQGGRFSHLQNSQPGNRPLYSAHFSRGQSVQPTSSRVLRPPVPRQPNSRENSKLSSSYQKILPKKQETVEEKKERLKLELNKFESPFNWRPRQDKPVSEPESIIKRMLLKDVEVKDERKFKWRNFIFHLVISYELWRAKKLSQAFEEICSLGSVLLLKINHADYMFNCIVQALRHVITASKAFLCLEQDMVTEAEQLIEEIQPRYTMDRKNQAGIHGIKAAMFMEYGHRGNKNALEEALMAVKLDQSGAEWHFLLSKCMGRIRRVAQCHELVDYREVKAINKALELDKRNGTYKVFLGQVLAERALREYKKYYPERNSELHKKITKINTVAKYSFKEAAELRPNCPHVLIRCARGMMKLPPTFKDLKFTKNCIDKAMELAPNNPMVHHVQAMYHERYDCDMELPLQAYEKAASLDNFGAAMDLVRLHHKLKAGDIVEELEILADKYEQTDKRQVIYTQAGSYLLFIKKDIIGAIKYYMKVIQIDPKSYAMMSHKPIFLRMKDPVNMFDVMLEELATKTDWKSFTGEDQKILRAFRFMIGEHEPSPTEERKKRLTVEEILDMARKRIEADDLYKETKAQGKRRHNLKRRKIWQGKKKVKNKNINVKSSANEKLDPKGEMRKPIRKNINKSFEPKSRDIFSNNVKHSGNEKLNYGDEMRKCSRKNINTIDEPRRRDSVSSVGTVDSDYLRDSTVYGPRDFFSRGSNESLCSSKSERFSSYKQKQSLDLTRESGVVERCYGQLHRTSRDSSISSISSACSGVSFVSSQGSDVVLPPANRTFESQLTVENMKKHDIENSLDTGIRRFKMLSLSNASSVSQASSSDTLSVMDRVKQSYAMLGRNSEPSQGKKKYFKKHGSTQSLNVHHKADWKEGSANKNTAKSGSSQSLNVLEENFDSKFSKSFKSRFASRDSSIESTRSLSFMPDFARKNSNSELEK